MKPEISVIMPVLNGRKYIAEAIESIAAQTFQNFELIVVNDGSTDETCQIVETFQSRIAVKIVHHPQRQGVPRCMNDGIRASAGGFICFLDHDDAWFPEFLETQYNYLQQHPDVGMAHTDFQTIDGAGRVLEASVAAARGRKRPSGHVFANLFEDNFIIGNSVMIRRECFDQVGLVDEGLRWGDYHMWLRIARRFKVDYVPRVLTMYRQHASQETQRGAVEESFEDPVAIASLKKLLEAHPEIRSEIGRKTIARRLAAIYFDTAWATYCLGSGRRTRIALRKAMALWPGNPNYWKLYAASLLDRSLAEGLRRIWHRMRGAEAAGITPAAN